VDDNQLAKIANMRNQIAPVLELDMEVGHQHYKRTDERRTDEIQNMVLREDEDEGEEGM